METSNGSMLLTESNLLFITFVLVSPSPIGVDLMRRQEELRRLEELRNQELVRRKQIEMRCVFRPVLPANVASVSSGSGLFAFPI